MEIGRYERPKTIEEAYALIVEEHGLPVAGGAWSHLMVKSAPLAVDLSDLEMRYIRDAGDRVEIGAMATARDVELSLPLAAEFGPLFRDATSHLVGVQLRNIITVGGSVAGKYGFSDINTVLLALNAELYFHGGQRIDMGSFLAAPRDKPFLLEKIAVRKGARAAFQSLRVTANDFAILNACAAYREGAWRIAVGARPAAARLGTEAARALGNEGRPSEAAARRAGEAAAAELGFGDDTRGSAIYRRSLCAVLVKRAILEASK
ncbi:MAG: FAD binding domain-containing protein [Spirochaetales bacterium]